MQINTNFLLSALPVLIVLHGCANRGAPLGGPKDITPPVVLSADPPDRSINYSPEKDITITFDEYIKLDNIYQELIISPPLEENVITNVVNKSIEIEFPKESIFDTTTYTISFGNSIADNNEGNVLSNYEFVFSLKDYIDSLNIAGVSINAFDLKPDKDRFYVMVYKNLSDSAPIKEKPKFISRTDELGYFSIHNIEDGKYRIFALKDLNNNMLFDLPEEQIAFADSAIELIAENLKNDTSEVEEIKLTPEIPKDLTKEKKKNDDLPESDTAKADTIIIPRKYTYSQELRFFKEEVKNQYMTNYLRTRPEMFSFTFNQTLTDSLEVELLNIETTNDWYLSDYNIAFDTVKFWLTDTSLVSKDSLQLKVSYAVYDSSGLLVPKIDTLFLNYIAKESNILRGKRRKGTLEKPSDSIPKPSRKLLLSNSINSTSTFDLNRKIIISSETPLDSVEIEKIRFYKIEDTLEIPLTSINITDFTMYGFTIEYTPEEITKYKLFIPDSVVYDIYGSVNDTTILSFKTQSEEYYGVLTMNLIDINGPSIIQLMDEKENIIRENIISADDKIRYEYLYPKNYILKLIIDSNNNGKWDTGKYLEHRQPEKVIYYYQVVNVRSNWEIELNWEIKN